MGYVLNKDNEGPKDSYGMPYRVPLDMISAEALTELPLFYSSVHNWINGLWINFVEQDLEWIGDGEFSHVLYDENEKPLVEKHRSFLILDPISGRTMKQA